MKMIIEAFTVSLLAAAVWDATKNVSKVIWFQVRFSDVRKRYHRIKNPLGLREQDTQGTFGDKSNDSSE